MGVRDGLGGLAGAVVTEGLAREFQRARGMGQRPDRAEIVGMVEEALATALDAQRLIDPQIRGEVTELTLCVYA